MGHIVEFYTYPENVDKKKVSTDLADYVEKACWEEGGHMCGSIQWIDKTFDTEEAAQDFIDKRCCGNYQQVAVKYRYLDPNYAGKEPAKLVNLKKQLQKTIVQIAEEEKPYFANHKSEFIGCPNCKSRIARKYLGNRCPVCNSDMRPKTVLDTIQKHRDKSELLREQIEQERRAYARKSAKDIRWLVKIEYHL